MLSHSQPCSLTLKSMLSPTHNPALSHSQPCSHTHNPALHTHIHALTHTYALSPIPTPTPGHAHALTRTSSLLIPGAKPTRPWLVSLSLTFLFLPCRLIFFSCAFLFSSFLPSLPLLRVFLIFTYHSIVDFFFHSLCMIASHLLFRFSFLFLFHCLLFFPLPNRVTSSDYVQ